MEWDIADWDTEETKAGKQTINQRAIDDRAMKTFEKSEAEHFKQTARLDKLCPIPAEGERWHIVTEKSFNAYSFILQQLQVGVVDELYLAIYRIGEPVVRGLLQLIESGQIRKATFITSNFFKENHKAEAWATALEKGCKYLPQTRCVFVHSHCKLCLLRRGDQHFVFQGSGNMSNNAKIEQYTYECNRQVYEFHKGWMEELAK